MSHPKLRVYGWVGMGSDGKQTREIVAMPSKEALGRKMKFGVRYVRDYVSETGNVTEIRVAIRAPGVVFCVPLNDSYGGCSETDWKRKS